MDGKWTLDSFAQQAKFFYSDLNGNSVKDMDDQIGYGIITGNMTDHLLFDAGNHMTTRGEKGYPIVNPVNERLLEPTVKRSKRRSAVIYKPSDKTAWRLPSN